jgi:asparagine synthase (glutamine-hydrolysing)
MCGIFAVFGNKLPTKEDIEKCMATLKNRGPEFSTYKQFGNVIMGFTRLAINGLTEAGHQPITVDNISVVCNGEIYNYKELAERWSIPLNPDASDCQVLPTLFSKLDPTEASRTLDGVFAMAIVDLDKQTITVVRDPYGVRPLFMGLGDGFQAFASEIKALKPICTSIRPFPPGSWYKFSLTSDDVSACGYHQIPWIKNPICDDVSVAKLLLHTALEKAVEKRLMSDRPIGGALSGGLDSSLSCAIAAKFLKKFGKQLTTFSIGMPGSTDLLYADMVAKHINSIHHTILLTPEDFFDAIPEVIKATETYDITSVRASVGNYLLGKYIKATTDIKVVINGDGSDECGGGYLYMGRAPSDEEFEQEITRLLKDINSFDVLRSDRCMSSHGLEPRTPFLDKQFVNVWRSIPTKHKRHTKTQPEKNILRLAFNEYRLLPRDVLWRKKEAFSDGVSATEKPWHQSINEFARTKIDNVDQLLLDAPAKYPHNTPKTAEALYYRMLFESYYGPENATIIPYFWMPKWSPETNDPSARTLSLY